MTFSKGERFGLSILIATVFSCVVMLCIYQDRCYDNYRYKNIWIKRNDERQEHGEAYRIDLRKGIIVKNERHKLFCFSEGLANVAYQDKWGFIDQKGEWVITPRFSGAWPFSNGLAGVMRKDKFGFIDKTGRMVIRPRFDNIRDFAGEGLTAVRVKRCWGFIDTGGRFVIEPVYEWADSFNEGLALVKQNGLYGYINSNGQYVIKPRYQDGFRFQERLAGVNINGKYGFINRQGKIVIKPGYDQVTGFSEGMAVVKANGSLGFINRDGKMVMLTRFSSLGNFYNGIAIAALSNRVFLLGQTGKIISTGFQDMQDFSGEYAAVGIDVQIKVRNQVKIKRKYGFCNSRLQLIGHFLYQEVWPYSQGLAAVRVGKQIQFVRDEAAAIEPKFDWVDPDKY
jgi:hypothetical protein